MRLTITKLFPLLIVAVFFSSCKKNIIYGDVAVNTFRPIVEFSEPTGFVSVAMDYSPNEITLDAADIRFMIRSDVKSNATVKVIFNPTVVADYNDANTTAYVSVPLSKVSLENDQLSLSPTERSQTIRIRIKPADVITGDNAIGLSIAEVNGGEISRIAGTLVIALSVKNEYDGRYLLEGAFYHPSLSPGYDPFSVEVEMRTSSLTSVKMFWPDDARYCHPGLFSGSLDAFAGQEPEYTINGTTNAVTVQNSSPGAVTFYTMASGFNSRYDPAAKIVYAKFGYNYSPGPVFNPATNREWTDKLTYLGPR